MRLLARQKSSSGEPPLASMIQAHTGDALALRDVVDLRWTPIDAKMSSKRQYCAAARVSDHEMIVIGGHDGSSYLSSAELYNTFTNEWTILPPMRHGKHLLPRHGCALAAVGRDVYAIGGFDGTSSLNVVQQCVKDSRVWRSQPPMRTRRTGCAAVTIGRKIYVVGGFDGNQTLRSCEVLDLDTNRWFSIPPMSAKRNRCAAAVIDEGRAIVVVGGNDGNGFLSSVEVFDVVSSVWRTLPSKLCKKRSACALVASSKFLFAIGGIDGEQSLRSVEVCDLETLKWQPARNTIRPREGCAAVTLRDKIFVVGGFDGHTDLDSTEQLLLEKVVPSTPIIPPVPSQDLSPEDRLVAMESWSEATQAERQRFKDKVANAKLRIKSDYTQSKRELDREIEKREKEIQLLKGKLMKEAERCQQHLRIMNDDAMSWFERVDQQVADVTERIKVLMREMEFREEKRQLEQKLREMQRPPSELLCCITLELMKDPVIAVADGHTYERFAIERVFARTPPGQLPRSPKTGASMSTRQLVPNVAIRAMCRDWAKQ